MKPPCTVPDCGRPIASRGYCWRHYEQVRKHGEVHERGPINYKAAHMRIRKERGPAREHPCVDCPEPASQWSYNRGSTEEMIGSSNGYPAAFSPNPSDYSPRCRTCHIEFDRKKRNPTTLPVG